MKAVTEEKNIDLITEEYKKLINKTWSLHSESVNLFHQAISKLPDEKQIDLIIESSDYMGRIIDRIYGTNIVDGLKREADNLSPKSTKNPLTVAHKNLNTSE